MKLYEVTYRVTLKDGQTFHFSGDLRHAGAPIHVNFHDVSAESDWQVTPYQTADARHIPERAALLLARHYATDDDDCTSVASVEAV